MSSHVATILARREKARMGRKPKRNALVFLSTVGGHVDESALRRAYVRARDALRERDGDVPKATFHQLRHTFGSRLAAQGVPILSIQRWMGHADVKTTMRYLHFVPQRDDAARVAAALAFDAGLASMSSISPSHADERRGGVASR